MRTVKTKSAEVYLSAFIIIDVFFIICSKEYLQKAGVELIETPYPVEGNAREEAVELVASIHDIAPSEKIRALITGGETTVNLVGDGKGGRNQEFALAFMLYALEKKLSHEWVFLSGGTDGRDGPTDAAGGMTDINSFMRMMKAGVNPVPELENNNAYAALKSSDDLVMTGGTGTNVADIQILLI